MITYFFSLNKKENKYIIYKGKIKLFSHLQTNNLAIKTTFSTLQDWNLKILKRLKAAIFARKLHHRF